MNIREEFLFSDVEKYLIQNISSVIIGNRSEDERCNVILESVHTNASTIMANKMKPAKTMSSLS